MRTSVIDPRRLLLALTLLAAGCATTSAGGATGNPDVITRAELDRIEEGTVHAAIVRLRPRWLRPRGQVSMSGQILPSVFIGEGERDNFDRLRTLRVAEVRDLRYLNPRDATTRYGTGFPAGIIFVTLRR